MKKGIQIPDIPEEQRTPLVNSLLIIIEQLAERVRLQDEEIALLKDEIRVLKGEKKRPTFKPSKMDEQTSNNKKDPPENSSGTYDGSEGKRAGSKKKDKTANLTIHETSIIQPEAEIPPGSTFKGYRDFVVQELEIQPHNTRYRLACWETPTGETLTGQLPASLNGQHFGPQLISYIIYQHHHCQVTQPLLWEQLREWEIDISAGTINRFLTEDREDFHSEKDELLKTGLQVSSHVTVDDSGARHQGKNGYVTHIGNEHFAWFESTPSKSRINFLTLLCAGDQGYRINQDAIDYLRQQKLPQGPLDKLLNSPQCYWPDANAWEAYLNALDITRERHRRIATEGALMGNLAHQGITKDLVIVSDDAGQFNILRHALCWIHTERLVHTMIPLNEGHREDIAKVRGQIWDFYADLKAYKADPTEKEKRALEKRFDTIFKQKTRYELLNQTLKRTHKNKAELLLVLDRPEIPLHTNGSEQDIRDYVKKRKVSGSTRSDKGRRCRDTFTSLKKTCRKQGLSFWRYLIDRISGESTIPLLSDLVRERAVVV